MAADNELDSKLEPTGFEGISRVVATGRFRVFWRHQKRQREKSFPADTPFDFMIQYRAKKMLVALDAKATAADSGSFPRDVVGFLRSRRGRECHASDRSHMKPWVKVFGRMSRFQITTEKITLAANEMSLPGRDGQPGKSPREIRHRLNILTQFFLFKDPNAESTPVDKVKRPKIPKSRPRRVADATIDQVAASLKRAEDDGRLRDGKTRARYLVLATTGKRPCQMQRAQPGDVDMTSRIWDVVEAKNAIGGPQYLNDEMLDAWKLFIAADAWGDYDEGSFSKTLRRHGWPGGRGGIRPYNLRHSTLQTAKAIGVDGDVVAAMGNHSRETSDRFYVDPENLAALKFAAEVIDGRFTRDVFAPREKKDYDKATDPA